MRPQLSQSKASSGFSFIELLATVGILGTLATVALQAIRIHLGHLDRVKLETQVSALNRAVDAYLNENGDLTSAASPSDVLQKLKTTAANAESIAGYRGAYVDPRLVAIMQTAEEAQSSAWRAQWDAASNRFVMLQSGTPGARAFGFDDEALNNLPAAEERELEGGVLADHCNWIWDFDETSLPSLEFVTAASTATLPESPINSTPTNRTQLLPPSFSIPGTDPIAEETYPLLVEIFHPNAPSAGAVWYSYNNSPWQVYTGPVTVFPGDQLNAYVNTNDPSRYLSSFVSTEYYQATALTLSGSASGTFTNPVGESLLVYNIWEENGDTIFEHGEAATTLGFDRGNILRFHGAAFENVRPDELFQLGDLYYYNSTTWKNTTATEITLDLTLSLSDDSTENFAFTLGLESTLNGEGMTLDEQADYVRFSNIYSSFSHTFSGEQYYLNLQFGYFGDDGYAELDEFHVHEGAEATGAVFGYFSKQPNDSIAN